MKKQSTKFGPTQPLQSEGGIPKVKHKRGRVTHFGYILIPNICLILGQIANNPVKDIRIEL